MHKAHLKRFGISVNKYEALFKAQKGLCAICQKPEVDKRNGKIKRLAVDHDHETGQIRGLLCQRCNTALGSFFESAFLLQSAIDYLNAFK